jgi:phosphatidylglycerol:prolipoprotein diacylglycerol transferase
MGPLLEKTSRLDPSFCTPDAVVEGVSLSMPLRELLAAEIAPRYPSQLVEAVLEGGVLFALLWILRTRVRLPDGVLCGVFFIAYAVLRVIGEGFREPDAPMTAGLTRGQFLSLFMILAGFLFLLSSRMNPRYPPVWRR